MAAGQLGFFASSLTTARALASCAVVSVTSCGDRNSSPLCSKNGPPPAGDADAAGGGILLQRVGQRLRGGIREFRRGRLDDREDRAVALRERFVDGAAERGKLRFRIDELADVGVDLEMLRDIDAAERGDDERQHDDPDGPAYRPCNESDDERCHHVAVGSGWKGQSSQVPAQRGGGRDVGGYENGRRFVRDGGIDAGCRPVCKGYLHKRRRAASTRAASLTKDLKGNSRSRRRTEASAGILCSVGRCNEPVVFLIERYSYETSTVCFRRGGRRVGFRFCAERAGRYRPQCGRGYRQRDEGRSAARGGDMAKVSAVVEQRFLPATNFERTTRIAVGDAWKQATPQQQQELYKQFRLLMTRTYAASLAQLGSRTRSSRSRPAVRRAPTRSCSRRSRRRATASRSAIVSARSATTGRSTTSTCRARG